MSAEPFVLDVNSRKVGNESAGKIIRPIEEQEETDDSENEVIGQEQLEEAMDMAKTLRDDAIEKASKIIADAEADAEAIRAVAREEGYNQGLEEGSMEAMKRADEYLANIHKEQEAIALKNEQLMEEAILDRESKLIDLTCGLIQKLTGILISDYKPVLLHIINNALNEVESSKKFVIKVSENNYSYVSDNHDRLVGAGNPNIQIEVYGDAKLDDQQCIIESDNGIIDLSMDIQTRNLITAIKILSE